MFNNNIQEDPHHFYNGGGDKFHTPKKKLKSSHCEKIHQKNYL